MTKHQHHPGARELADALARLGYPSSWVEAGIIEPREVLAQLPELGRGPPDMDEHRRYSTMLRYLQRQTAFAEDQFGRVIALTEGEHDRQCGDSMLLDLLSHPGLSDTQFERLAGHRLLVRFTRRVLRVRLLRELDRRGPSDPWYRAVVASGDAALQRRVAADRATPRWVFEELARAGCNTAIRNVAAERLRGTRRADV